MLSETLPFLQKFCGKTIVVQYGGAAMNKVGATVVGLSGLDGCILTARPNPKAADLGFVGEVARVDTAVLLSFIAAATSRSTVVVLGAEKQILLNDVAGILEDGNDSNSLVKKSDIKRVKKMVEERKVGNGMIPRVNCCVRSLAQGVINMEWGNFRSNLSLTEYDLALDVESLNPREQCNSVSGESAAHVSSGVVSNFPVNPYLVLSFCSVLSYGALYVLYNRPTWGPSFHCSIPSFPWSS
ncbi:hypothetical protein LR48_Vigan11g030700 [Vigna angularis]|uniref:hexokinase n=1 Tax=Phaseolus angularis TaxID=3914 RepID=A0A0L9VQD1_PHAAN|nr:hypothetical protein LR48_Vigan11g030700 [Vigna angularis]